MTPTRCLHRTHKNVKRQDTIDSEDLKKHKIRSRGYLGAILSLLGDARQLLPPNCGKRRIYAAFVSSVICLETGFRVTRLNNKPAAISPSPAPSHRRFISSHDSMLYELAR